MVFFVYYYFKVLCINKQQIGIPDISLYAKFAKIIENLILEIIFVFLYHIGKNHCKFN